MISTSVYPQVIGYFWNNGTTGASQVISQPDTFYLTAIDSFGCLSYSDTLLVRGVSLLPVTLSMNKPPLLCESDSVLLFADTVYQYYSYQWVDGTTGAVLNVKVSGNYYLTGTDTNGCVAVSDTITVQQSLIPKPNIQMAGPTTICNDDSALLYISPVAGITYQWNNSVTDTFVIADTTMEFWVLASETLFSPMGDTVVCMMTSDTVLISEAVTPLPIIDLSGKTSFCEGEGVIMFVDSPVTGLYYLWNNGVVNTVTYSDTTYTFSVTAIDSIFLYTGDTVVCARSSDSIEVNEITLAKPVINSLGSLYFCEGGGVQLFVNPDTGNLYYVWNNKVQDTIVYSDTGSAYFVTAIDSIYLINGDTIVCSKNSDVVQVKELVLIKPIINFTSPVIFCSGGGVQLFVNPAPQMDYLWSDGTTGTEIYTDTSGGYTVTAIDTFIVSADTVVCTKTSDTVKTREISLPKPVVQSVLPLAFCDGDSAILFFNPDSLSYQWNNGATDTLLIAGTSNYFWVAGYDTFFLPGNDTLVCGVTSDTVFTVEIIIQKPLILSNGPTLFCEGGGVQLFISDINGISAVWSTGQTDTIISVDTSGSYFVTAFDTNGCTKASDTVTVNVISIPGVTLNDTAGTLLCGSDTLWLSAGSFQQYSILWSTGDTVNNIPVTTAGSYYFSVYDTNGCASFSDTLFISGSPANSILLQQRCDSLFANGSFISYHWFHNDSILITDTLSYLIVKKNGQYFLIATDSSGCDIFSDTLNIYTAKKASGINIYPNPVSSRLMIESDDLPDDDLEIEVVSAFGTRVSEEKTKPQQVEIYPESSGCNGFKNIFSVPLNVEKMEPGVYFIIIRSQYIQNSFKVIKM